MNVFLRRNQDVLTAALAMLLVAFALAGIEYVQLSERQIVSLSTQARLIARTASAAVLFDAPADAADILQAFDAAPSVLGAQLLRADGRALARYQHAPAPRDWLDEHGGTLDVDVDVMANGKAVGRLQLTALCSPVWRTLLNVMASVLGIMFIALVFTRMASRGRRAAHERLRHLAHHDALTGVANRAAFTTVLERTLAQAGDGDSAAALLCIDLDNFKQVNDADGHAAGDRVLVAIARSLQALVRPGDQVARLGGDEFAVLMAAPVDDDAVHQLAARLVAELPAAAAAVTGSHHVSVSVGTAALPRDAAALEEAMHCADLAMYQAKRNGKDSFAAFSPAMGETRRRSLALEHDLRHALAEGALELAYQPIFDRQGRLASFEALARWRHPQRGLVPPVAFIPVAEESGLVGELGLANLAQLRRDLDAWTARGLQPPRVALNLSSREFRREAHHTRFLAELQRLALSPAELEFELTESSVFEDLDSPSSILPRLRELGYVLAIDDFGTGYSSLGYLRRMKCQKLKIDRVFIAGIGQGHDAAVLVEALIRVAHPMQMTVVAEGVEWPEDHARLLAMGCDLFQGFGLARPLWAADVPAFLAGHQAVSVPQPT
jgi:diguanylate cyclase (GGDEF)-like protein